MNFKMHYVYKNDCMKMYASILLNNIILPVGTTYLLEFIHINLKSLSCSNLNATNVKETSNHIFAIHNNKKKKKRENFS